MKKSVGRASPALRPGNENACIIPPQYFFCFTCPQGQTRTLTNSNKSFIDTYPQEAAKPEVFLADLFGPWGPGKYGCRMGADTGIFRVGFKG